jgi:hypothetical protein
MKHARRQRSSTYGEERKEQVEESPTGGHIKIMGRRIQSVHQYRLANVSRCPSMSPARYGISASDDTSRIEFTKLGFWHSRPGGTARRCRATWNARAAWLAAIPTWFGRRLEGRWSEAIDQPYSA